MDGELQPYCIEDKRAQNNPGEKLKIGAKMVFSYEVEFIHSDKDIGSRWDYYKFLGNDEVHWFSIINSSIIILFLSVIVAHILRRVLSRDI